MICVDLVPGNELIEKDSAFAVGRGFPDAIPIQIREDGENSLELFGLIWLFRLRLSRRTKRLVQPVEPVVTALHHSSICRVAQDRQHSRLVDSRAPRRVGLTDPLCSESIDLAYEIGVNVWN